jgi:hypothetical protein
MRFWKFLLPLLASTLCFAQQDRIPGPIDSSQRMVLPGRIPHQALPQYDQGRVEPTFQLDYVTMLFAPSASQSEALDLLLAQQQDAKSPNYHKWLTPEQFGARFGLGANDMQKITGWLRSKGLQIVSVARGGQFLVFAGTAAQVENAFQTEIHRYDVEGETHFANATLPSIPTALAGIAVGFRGLNDFRMKPAIKLHPDYTLTGASTHFIAPGDIATIYDINPLYSQSPAIDGTGQKMVLVGQTDIYIDDINDFRTDFGLSSVSSCNAPPSCDTTNLQYIQATSAPGYQAGDLAESDLDLEWSGAVARNAKLIFVTSNAASGGVSFSAQYAIDQNLAPVISMSYGQCEFDATYTGGPTLATQDLLYKQAAGQGISFFAASGDDGPAICDIYDSEQDVTSAVGGLAVDYPASSWYVTGVGGTEFNEGSGTYWGTTNDPTYGGSAISYIPEKSWNDFPELGFLDGGGGGPSNCFNQTSNFGECVSGNAKPSWQTGPGVPADGVRDVPDVSLSASNYNDPYIVCTPLSEVGLTGSTSTCASGIQNALKVDNSAFGGTSASTPLMAGITVLLNQYLSSTGGLGNINPMLYSLAASSPAAFHDTPAGSNSTVNCTAGEPGGQPAALVCPQAGTFGYDTTTAYDVVTGLGSVDANQLAIAWQQTEKPDFTLTPSTPSLTVSAGNQASAVLTISPVSGSTAMTVNFAPTSCTGLPSGATCAFSPTSVYFDGTGNAPPVTVTITTLPNMAASGPTTVTITPTNSTATAIVSLTVTTTTESFTLSTTSGATTFPVTVGATAQVSITVSSTTGFIVGSGTPGATTALPLTYTCTGSPSLPTAEISCQLPNAGQPTNATSVTVSLITTAPTSQLRPPLGGSRIFYALLLPGMFGLVFVAGSRTRGLRLLSLIVVLGFSTLWLGACGGGSTNTSPKNPGTPAGTYTITVSATTGGANPVTNSSAPFTFTLVVN